ncbi:hypothetical protein [Gymnodinialimonas ceratoperidinii]|uniref:Uncharacterized protein n=1 Tax=Gymnodinialimonas ceratoperidinii TaxID=2856823 RepID=A0A8F6TYB4_9RHOB|nr:hypothetical protein [Gymnodinialimonas ceratoperidinii]QXT41157.1 hypothetical protein KYE46_08100 [Gymnodinialimonas ceratoperidinii]
MKTSTDWKGVRWESVKGVANNDFTRVVALIPVAGYLILFNDEIAAMASFDSLAGVGEADRSPFFLDGLTKLRLVFFGSLFVLCSFLIYRLFRPGILEASKNDLEFSELVRQRYSVYELVQMEEHVHSETWTERTAAFWMVLGKRRPRKPVVSGYRPDVRVHMFSKHGDYIGFLAREWWVGMMHTHRPARISSLVFGAGGYAMLALPTLDIAQAVLQQLFTG